MFGPVSVSFGLASVFSSVLWIGGLSAAVAALAIMRRRHVFHKLRSAYDRFFWSDD